MFMQNINVLAAIPQRNWHLTFEIPDGTTFSSKVQRAIADGIVVGRVRREVVQVLRTLMLQHTKYPSRDQYNTVCEKLLIKFPKLRDDVGSLGYVSKSVQI